MATSNGERMEQAKAFYAQHIDTTKKQIKTEFGERIPVEYVGKELSGAVGNWAVAKLPLIMEEHFFDRTFQDEYEVPDFCRHLDHGPFIEDITEILEKDLAKEIRGLAPDTNSISAALGPTEEVEQALAKWKTSEAYLSLVKKVKQARGGELEWSLTGFCAMVLVIVLDVVAGRWLRLAQE